MSRLTFFILFLVFTIVNAENLYASHLRAGDITIKVISLQTRTYEFTLTLYRDAGGVPLREASLNFGDNSSCISKGFNSMEVVGKDIEKYTFKYQHSYGIDGTFLVSFYEDYRNENIVNINNGNSKNTSFYIETLMVIDVFNKSNSTPVLPVPPVDFAARGQLYTYNSGAYDPDNGDSVSFELVTPKAYISGEDKCHGSTQTEINNYLMPDNPSFNGISLNGGSATLTLDPATGDLVWNTPGKPGDYNVAFKVKEWRKIDGTWVEIGYVLRDMQITVEDTKNHPPKIMILRDTCVVAGTVLNEEIKAEDPDNNRIFLSSYSEVYTLKEMPAHFTGAMNKEAQTSKANPVSETFTWTTSCNHIRKKPYQINFKAKDQPSTTAISPLTDVKSWRVTVVGPAPKGLIVAASADKSINLFWDTYTCANADSILIYRKEGPYDFTPSNCELGIPEGVGYQLIGKVKSNSISFNDKFQVNYGVQYCYRLVASFPNSGGSVSYASIEACTQLEIVAPIITNVTVEQTGEKNGMIKVRWMRPIDLDTIKYPGPYSYNVFRSEGLGSIPDQLAATLDNIKDTTFIDEKLNTTSLVYTYKVVLSNGQSKDIEGETSSSVRLTSAGTANSVTLDWNYKTPWVNTDFLVYRRLPGNDDFILIDTTNTRSYIDSGKGGIKLLPEQEYCYFIASRGTYYNDRIPSPLINKSQIICQVPGDTIAPCAPVLSLAPIDCDMLRATGNCDVNGLYNTLTWTNNLSDQCQKDISYYKIYYTANNDSTGWRLLVNKTENSTFLHKNNELVFAGCYAVTPVDRSGNEGKPSNIVCNDNCPFLEFPNVITPNGDQINETFGPMNENGKCPWFVKKIDLMIVNRWGNVVYNSEDVRSAEQNTSLISWNGKSNAGKEVATGTYFYYAQVHFITLDPSKSTKKYKGWLQVLK